MLPFCCSLDAIFMVRKEEWREEDNDNKREGEGGSECHNSSKQPVCVLWRLPEHRNGRPQTQVQHCSSAALMLIPLICNHAHYARKFVVIKIGDGYDQSDDAWLDTYDGWSMSKRTTISLPNPKQCG